MSEEPCIRVVVLLRSIPRLAKTVSSINFKIVMQTRVSPLFFLQGVKSSTATNVLVALGKLPRCRLRKKAINDAEGFKQKTILEAEGDFETNRLEAEAEFLLASREQEGRAQGYLALSKAM